MLQPPGAHRQTGLSPACPVGCLCVCLCVSTFLVCAPVVCRRLSVSVCPSPSSVSLSFRLSVRRLLSNHLHSQPPSAVAERPMCQVASTLRRQTDSQTGRQTGRQAVCLPLGLRLVCGLCLASRSLSAHQHGQQLRVAAAARTMARGRGCHLSVSVRPLAHSVLSPCLPVCLCVSLSARLPAVCRSV